MLALRVNSGTANKRPPEGGLWVTTVAVRELRPPQLQFGGAVTTSDPKIGLDLAGPFDLRFGAARQTQVKVGIIGPRQLVDQTRRWLERCRSPVPVLGTPTLLQKPFPGFAKTFHMSLVDSA